MRKSSMRLWENTRTKYKPTLHIHFLLNLRLTLPSEGIQSPTPGTSSFSSDLSCAGLFYHSEGWSSQPVLKRSLSTRLAHIQIYFPLQFHHWYFYYIEIITSQPKKKKNLSQWYRVILAHYLVVWYPLVLLCDPFL